MCSFLYCALLVAKIFQLSYTNTLWPEERHSERVCGFRTFTAPNKQACFCTSKLNQMFLHENVKVGREMLCSVNHLPILWLSFLIRSVEISLSIKFPYCFYFKAIVCVLYLSQLNVFASLNNLKWPSGWNKSSIWNKAQPLTSVHFRFLLTGHIWCGWSDAVRLMSAHVSIQTNPLYFVSLYYS